MASNHIPIDTGLRLGQRLRRGVDVTREALTLLTEAKDVMEEMIDGTDYSVVEARYGLPAGKGQTAYNLVVAARTAVQSTATTQLINRLG